ncbi:MAG: hypothetical protein WCF85_03520 [Rhodospirillaceae bacterium]
MIGKKKTGPGVKHYMVSAVGSSVGVSTVKGVGRSVMFETIPLPSGEEMVVMDRGCYERALNAVRLTKADG